MSSSPLFKRTPLFLAISTLVSISSYSHALDEGSQQLPTIKVQATQDDSTSEKPKLTPLKIAQVQPSSTLKPKKFLKPLMLSHVNKLMILALPAPVTF
ncbi:hypothetical protein ACFOGQ_13275 [Acinetobacter vivianii]